MDFTVLKGVLLFGLGIFTIVWLMLKLTACIFMSIVITNFLGFTGWGWWLSTILFFCIIGRLIFSKDTVQKYEELIKDFEEEEIEKNGL